LSLYGLLYATYAQFLASQQPDSLAADSVLVERFARASELAQRMLEQTSFGSLLQP
jgi:hypothetical protein